MSRVKLKKCLTVFILAVITLISFFPFYMMLIMGTYKTENLADAISMLPGNYLLEILRKQPVYYRCGNGALRFCQRIDRVWAGKV